VAIVAPGGLVIEVEIQVEITTQGAEIFNTM
jgi:hypothetical protein